MTPRLNSQSFSRTLLSHLASVCYSVFSLTQNVFYWNMNNVKFSFPSRSKLRVSLDKFFLTVFKILPCHRRFFGNSIAIIARMFCGNHFNLWWSSIPSRWNSFGSKCPRAQVIRLLPRYQATIYCSIMQWTHYLLNSDWPNAYSEFSKSAPVTSFLQIIE